MKLLRGINVRGEVFAVAVSFAAMLVMRLGSSIILSRLLYPEAYGLLTILMSILFAIEMLSDIGATNFVIRHERGEEMQLINTVWSVRLCRSVLNAILLYLAAPWIGQLYGSQSITEALRALSLIFIFGGLETMSYAVAARRKMARITAYIELICVLSTTIITIALAYILRSYWALVIAVLIQRALMSICSYFIFPEMRPRFKIHREDLPPLFGFIKFAMPGSMLTLAVTQYDKLIFPRMFDIHLLGLYGISQNISGTIATLAIRSGQSVLYPRCSQWYRDTPESMQEKLYQENKKLIFLLMAICTLVGGAAMLVIQLLYDSRYEYAGRIMQIMMVRATLESMLSLSLCVMTSTGYIKGELITSGMRLASVILFSATGYAIDGFIGFMIGLAIEPLPALLYITYRRYLGGLGRWRIDLKLITKIIVAWLAVLLLAVNIESSSWWAHRPGASRQGPVVERPKAADCKHLASVQWPAC